jgi:phenol 2-monooxygenase
VIELPSVGRYCILVMVSNDLLDRSGASQSALLSCIKLIHRFPASMIELVIIHPLTKRFEWSDMPSSVKEAAEMRTYGLAKKENAYEIYGVHKDRGLITAIRPDGYIGMLAPLSDSESVEAYFRACLIRV